MSRPIPLSAKARSTSIKVIPLKSIKHISQTSSSWSSCYVDQKNTIEMGVTVLAAQHDGLYSNFATDDVVNT